MTFDKGVIAAILCGYDVQIDRGTSAIANPLADSPPLGNGGATVQSVSSSVIAVSTLRQLKCAGGVITFQIGSALR